MQSGNQGDIGQLDDESRARLIVIYGTRITAFSMEQ